MKSSKTYPVVGSEVFHPRLDRDELERDPQFSGEVHQTRSGLLKIARHGVHADDGEPGRQGTPVGEHAYKASDLPAAADAEIEQGDLLRSIQDSRGDQLRRDRIGGG